MLSPFALTTFGLSFAHTTCSNSETCNLPIRFKMILSLRIAFSKLTPTCLILDRQDSFIWREIMEKQCGFFWPYLCCHILFRLSPCLKNPGPICPLELRVVVLFWSRRLFYKSRLLFSWQRHESSAEDSGGWGDPFSLGSTGVGVGSP